MSESEKYDKKYTITRVYKKHYSRIIYYKVWNYIANHLTQDDKVLDLGCGPGHLAHILYDRGFKNYVGIDFSKVAISMARTRVPSFIFINDDLNNINYSDYINFKFISTECFEHLEDDIKIIRKLPKNDIIFSVPSYMAQLHYRVYKNESFIREYYKSVLNVNNITSFKLNSVRTIFVVEASIYGV
jgi:trans-aconitate methyltransferase